MRRVLKKHTFYNLHLIANKLYSIKIIPPRTEKRLAKKKRIEKKQFFLADIHYVLNTMV